MAAGNTFTHPIVVTMAITFILFFITLLPISASAELSSISSAPAPSPTEQIAESPKLALPLHTHSRWIVGSDGKRVKMACVNWPSHMEVVLAEGLNQQPLDKISKAILEMGFNCVRLTWPIRLATDGILAVVTTVRQSFINNELSSLIPGLEANNPEIVDLPLIEAFQAVVKSLADNNVMIILDNHLTVPGWCCSENDDNGFFGDKFFNPNHWINGLTEMATMFKHTPQVVAMSLRNELRGPKSNIPDWYTYMQQGAEAVHRANPNVLVLLSGLNYATDLSFLKTKPVNLSFIHKRKLAFEVHWYSFTAGRGRWEKGNSNDVCARVVGSMYNQTLFLARQGYPMLMTEFGLNMKGGDYINSYRYLNCLVALVAKMDMDWAYWALPTSYYKRNGIIGMNDTFGLLTSDWKVNHNENPIRAKFMKMIKSVQLPLRGPNIGGHGAKPYQIIFHPTTGQCVVMNRQSLELGPCSQAQPWRYHPKHKTIYIVNPTDHHKKFMLQAIDAGQQLKLVVDDSSSSKWYKISASGLHLSTKVTNNRGTQQLCLDVQSANEKVIVTNHCKCLTKDNHCTPFSQWFMLLSAKENPKKTANHLVISSS